MLSAGDGAQADRRAWTTTGVRVCGAGAEEKRPPPASGSCELVPGEAAAESPVLRVRETTVARSQSTGSTASFSGSRTEPAGLERATSWVPMSLAGRASLDGSDGD